MDFTSESLSTAFEALIGRSDNGATVSSQYSIAARRLSARLRSHPRTPIERAGDIFVRELNEIAMSRAFGEDPALDVARVPRVRGMTTLEFLSPYALFGGLCLAALAIAGLLVAGATYYLLMVLCTRALPGGIFFMFMYASLSGVGAAGSRKQMKEKAV